MRLTQLKELRNMLMHKIYHSKIKLMLVIVVVVFLWFLNIRRIFDEKPYYYDYETIKQQYYEALNEMVKEYNGTGCDVPRLEVYSSDIVKLLNHTEPMVCDGEPDWVNCYSSACSLTNFAIDTLEEIRCVYRDIIHINDHEYKFGPRVVLKGDADYYLVKSDHVVIACSAWPIDSYRFMWNQKSWSGYGIGLRPIKQKIVPKGREKSINILMITLDSVSRARFELKLPETYKYLRETLNATCLDKYNIVGDGTHEAILPIFTGKRYFEMEDSRKEYTKNYFNLSSMLFYQLNDYGYKTAYLEDTPWTGTFQFRYNGFYKQPTDHYLRSILTVLENDDRQQKHCVGATEQFQVILDLVDKMMDLDGKKFIFSFISDITHDHDMQSLHLLSNIDEPLVDILKSLLNRGHHKDTLIIVMGDHGSRFGKLRSSYNGAMEERLPFMAIRLPDVLKERRPDAQKNLESNIKVLTTPHDIHTTLLDALDLPQYMNTMKVKGATLERGLSILKPIPMNRSCGEAGITPFWCTCLKWDDVPAANPMYLRVAHTLVEYINNLTSPLRSICALRTLSSVDWVSKPRFRDTKDSSYWNYIFKYKARKWSGTYKVMLTAGPGKGVFEGLVKHNEEDDSLVVYYRDISRLSAYGSQANCVEKQFPHLNPFCFCTV